MKKTNEAIHFVMKFLRAIFCTGEQFYWISESESKMALNKQPIVSVSRFYSQNASKLSPCAIYR